MAITIFFLVISIIMLADMASHGNNIDYIKDPTRTGLIAYLQRNPNFYLWVFVVPLFVLLAANIIGLVVYVRKITQKEPVKVDELTDEQKEALRQELLKELQGDK